MKNSFCWLQLQSQDMNQIKTFYNKLFDWKLTDPESKDMPYIHIDTGEGAGGGIMQTEKGIPSSWLVYVQVKNLKQYRQKAKALGASILVPPTAIPTGGHYSVIKDPEGATIGLYQPPEI